MSQSPELIRNKVQAIAKDVIEQKSLQIDDMAERVKKNEGPDRAQEMALHLKTLRQRITQDITSLADRRTQGLIDAYNNEKDQSQRKLIVASADKKFDQEVTVLMDRRVQQMMDDLNGGLLTYEQTTMLINGFIVFIILMVVLFILYVLFY